MTLSDNGAVPHEISASWETLMRQAGMTAAQYLDAAVSKIDATFGKGYAAKNPVLVAGFMKAAALDFHASSIGVAAQRIRDSRDELYGIAPALQQIADDVDRAVSGDGSGKGFVRVAAELIS